MIALQHRLRRSRAALMCVDCFPRRFGSIHCYASATRKSLCGYGALLTVYKTVAPISGLFASLQGVTLVSLLAFTLSHPLSSLTPNATHLKNELQLVGNTGYGDQVMRKNLANLMFLQTRLHLLPCEYYLTLRRRCVWMAGPDMP